MTQILSIDCPNCHRENLIDNGDVSDQTVSDVEDFKCWSCGKSFAITDEGDVGAELPDGELSFTDGEQRHQKNKPRNPTNRAMNEPQPTHPDNWTRVTIDAYFPPGVAEQILLTAGRNPHELVAPDTPSASFQCRVGEWMNSCFGVEISSDQIERNHRFLEEAIELVQACKATQSECRQLVDYVYGRPEGKKSQEAGGVMVTLAALCLAQKMDMQSAGETELARIWTKIEKIRQKQANKPKHSPLPESSPSLQSEPPAPGMEKKAASVAREDSDAAESRALTAVDAGDHELTSPRLALEKTPITPIIRAKNAGDQPKSCPLENPIASELLERAAVLQREGGRLSIPMVKRRLGVAYRDAVRIVERIEARKVMVP